MLGPVEPPGPRSGQADEPEPADATADSSAGGEPAGATREPDGTVDGDETSAPTEPGGSRPLPDPAGPPPALAGGATPPPTAPGQPPGEHGPGSGQAPGEQGPGSGQPPGEQGPGSGQPPVEHGPVYYIFRNLGRMVATVPGVRPVLKFVPVVLLVGLFVFRFLLHPHIIAIRKRSPVVVGILLCAAVVVALGRLAPERKGLRRVLAVAFVAGWLALLLAPVDVVREMSLWYGYHQLDRRTLERLPVTLHERVFPLTMVRRIVEDRITASHFEITGIELIRDGQDLYWVGQKTPAGMVNRMSLEDVTGLVRVHASRPSFELQHVAVRFAQGRDMPLIKDLVRYVLPRQLGPLDVFDHEIDPDDVTYLPDRDGHWVQVIGVVDWHGVFPFVVPRFAGVFVVPERGRGDIRFVPPDRIASEPFLRGQNLLPEDVSRFYAESWKFNQGFWGWLRNRGVTKITTIPEDTNQQPFTVYFRDVAGEEGLYQFYALEPEGRSSGLSKILLFDPSGREALPRVYVHDFEARGLELVGPARIAETIRGSDLHADWKQRGAGGTFVIAESRPFIKESGGRRTFRWFNSIITEERGSNLPIVVIADPGTLAVEWYQGERIAPLLKE